MRVPLNGFVWASLCLDVCLCVRLHVCSSMQSYMRAHIFTRARTCARFRALAFVCAREDAKRGAAQDGHDASTLASWMKRGQLPAELCKRVEQCAWVAEYLKPECERWLKDGPWGKAQPAKAHTSRARLSAAVLERTQAASLAQTEWDAQIDREQL